MNSSSQHIVIIGGGISGLATAHRLCELRQKSQLPIQITLLEAKNRLGGVIDTEIRNGFLMEGGPDSFISEKPWATELCKRIGLQDQVVGTRDEFRQSFIYHQGKLVPVPSGFYLVAPARLKALVGTPLLSWGGKFRIACELLIPPKRNGGDESVAAFLRRRLGREALERIGQPMISGIYTADLEKLSLEATLPRFQEMERRYGSIIRGLQESIKQKASAEKAASGPRYSLFLTLREGISKLVTTLVERMEEVDFRCASRVLKIERGNRWKLHLEDGKSIEADLVCLALPAPQASRLTRPFAKEIADPLSEIPYESVATVNLAFPKSDIPHPLNGFGFVVPHQERRKLVGCTFSSVKYPARAPEGKVLLRAFVGGALHRDVFELDDARMEQMVLQELQDALGVTARPLHVSIRRYPKAMPQYHVGHVARVTSIEAQLENYPGFYLTGNAYRGIGLPDCIHQGEKTAKAMFAYSERKFHEI